MISPNGLRDVVLLILACICAAVQEPGSRNQDVPIRLVEDGTIVEMEFHDTPLADVLAAAQTILEVPLAIEPAEIALVVVHQVGLQRVPRVAFRDAFDGLLRRYEFWTADDLSGGDPVIRVFKPNRETRFGSARLPIVPPVVTLEDLAAGRGPRAPLFSAVINLRHAPAVDVLAAIRDSVRLDAQFETTVAVETSNCLVAVASRDHLLALAALVAALDVPRPRGLGTDEQLSTLHERLTGVEQRLSDLERQLRG